MIVFGLAAVNKSVFVSACPLFHVRLRHRKFVFYPSHPGGGGSGGDGGKNVKSPVNFMNCRENR